MSWRRLYWFTYDPWHVGWHKSRSIDRDQQLLAWAAQIGYR